MMILLYVFIVVVMPYLALQGINLIEGRNFALNPFKPGRLKHAPKPPDPLVSLAHETRALEAALQGDEDGFIISELTTCPDPECDDCKSHPKQLPGAPEWSPENRFVTAMDDWIKEQERAVQAAEARLRVEEILREDHHPDEFRPSLVPARATATIHQTPGQAVQLVWAWDDKTYLQIVKGYRLHLKVKAGMITEDKPTEPEAVLRVFDEKWALNKQIGF